MSHADYVFFSYAAAGAILFALALWQRWDYKNLLHELTVLGAPVEARRDEDFDRRAP